MQKKLNNTQHPPNESALLAELLEIAEAIERWTIPQRKDYLFGLIQREFKEGKTLRRNLVKIMLINNKKRQRFIRLVKSGKIHKLE
ncbi:MAG: hypothetical protein KKF54_02825 [Candidatus Omnitrophica bacterium]|nr:hypothetical protein [Candidatus Omnitrophota bacterium]